MPPLCYFATTGGGTVRFNPNLYQTGKVCLSILGTWHGDDSISKWQPDVSNVQQVLVSIQALILVDEPWFNEPGHEKLRNTPSGERRSNAYNQTLRLHTLRHAVLGQLRRHRQPPFAELIADYARVQAAAIRAQARRWCDEAPAKLRTAFERVRDEIDAVLLDILVDT